MNMKFAAKALGVALLMSAATSLPTQAAKPPLGMQLFCLNYASNCRADTVDQVAMSDRLMGMMIQVNSRVNGSMRYKAETGMIDDWKIGGRTGDCEDYALTKRAQLISKGVPAGALRIATTKTRRGEPHAILVVRTSKGDFVLDNLSAEVKTRRAAGYRLQQMSTSNPLVWTTG